MDILTLELFDVTVSQALTEVNRALEQHPGLPLRVLLDGQEMVLHNLQRFLERQHRKVVALPMGAHWQLDIAPVPAAPSAPSQLPLPAPVIPHAAPKPVLLFRSAFSPGDRALGRRLLLGLLETVDTPVPWVGLVHEALELLEDPVALGVLEALQARGIPVRLSRGSLAFFQREPGSFPVLEDAEWQSLAARGSATIL